MFLETVAALVLLALFWQTAKWLAKHHRPPPPQVHGFWTGPPQIHSANNLNGFPFRAFDQGGLAKTIWTQRMATTRAGRHPVNIPRPPFFHPGIPSPVMPEPPGEVQIRLDLTKTRRSD